MTNKRKKEKTREILYNLEENLKKRKLPIDKENKLDLVEFNNLPEVRKESAKLKAMNITRYWLFNFGFTQAGTVLSLGEEMKHSSLQLSGKDILI